jgi:hypothetical protein
MPKLNLGIGAECKVLLKFLHPRKLINDLVINPTNNQRLERLLVIRQERKTVNRKEQLCVVFRHDSCEGKELYVVAKYALVTLEGAPEHFFKQPRVNPTPVLETAPEVEAIEIEQNIYRARNTREDIEMVEQMGFQVDDDNNPAPENIPDRTNRDDSGLKWGWNGFDARKESGNCWDSPARLTHFDGIAVKGITHVNMFLLFLPTTFFKDCILKQMNDSIAKNGGSHVSWGEFLRWIGILLYMSTITGFKRRDFWSLKPVNVYDGIPYRFSEWMSLNRYQEILSHLKYTDNDRPSYPDRFWEVRLLIEEWNINMSKVFNPSWVSCLDESMSIWHNKYTCPGWMFVPRKPHPFGNEYHTICCSLSNIMYAIEIVEGKDKPPEKPLCPHTGDKSPTVGLLLRLCRSLIGTGKVVILDSGFCVLEGLIQLRKNGIYASAVIKKRRYWPKYVPGDKIDSYMNEKKAVGECDALYGTLDGVPYHIFCQQEPNYVNKLMSTYGGLTVDTKEFPTSRTYLNDKGESVTKSFFYKQPFSNHIKFRHSCDDHNNNRHQVPSIEGTWITSRWANRVFSFILAISEVNSFLAFQYFIWKPAGLVNHMTLHQFRRKLALKLIYNDFLKTDEEIRKTKRRKKEDKDQFVAHALLTAPPYAKNYLNGKWNCTAKKMYQQYTCKGIGCKKLVRTFCRCSPGTFLCGSCHTIHLIDEVTEK